MSITLLSDVLPNLWSLACDLAGELQTGKYQSWQAINPRLQDLFSPEISKSCEMLIPGWRKIAKQRNGLTATHTLLVLAGCLRLPEYLAAPVATRHEIEWAAVLHDVDKNYDLHTNRKDASHPFRSAAVAVKGLPRLGFLPQPGVAFADLEHWSALVMNSERPEDGRMVHDHSHLAEIIAFLYQHWGVETPASRILKAILFHQSLPTLKAWPNPVLLKDNELYAYLTINDLNVLLPLLVADSHAWELFNENRNASLDELRANNAETRRRLNQEPL
jgi:hypothetical protein